MNLITFFYKCPYLNIIIICVFSNVKKYFVGGIDRGRKERYTKYS